MHVLLAVSAGAVYTVWWVSLAIFLVVLVVVAILLTLILNTVQIPLLVTTNQVVDAIHTEARKILGAATRIQEHAESCYGCPRCVLSPVGDKRGGER